MFVVATFKPEHWNTARKRSQYSCSSISMFISANCITLQKTERPHTTWKPQTCDLCKVTKLRSVHLAHSLRLVKRNARFFPPKRSQTRKGPFG
jgi:uncharacterized cysteine cluster protein YcgN (CxxCxxCC family)